jgi:hypothetical protein
VKFDKAIIGTFQSVASSPKRAVYSNLRSPRQTSQGNYIDASRAVGGEKEEVRATLLTYLNPAHPAMIDDLNVDVTTHGL